MTDPQRHLAPGRSIVEGDGGRWCVDRWLGGALLCPIYLNLRCSIRGIWPRWMFTQCVEHATQIDQSWTIQLKRCDGCSACRRQAKHEGEVIVPGKMFFPAMLARMKQRHERVGDGIGRSNAHGFMLITAVTTVCQIISRGGPNE